MERLTLEEAICRVRGVAKKQRWNSKYTKVSLMNEELNKRHKADCIKDAEEHEQLAEWLEELKSYKDAEEHGLLVRLPCKVGDDLYCIVNGEVKKLKVHSFGVPDFEITDIEFKYVDGFKIVRFVGEIGKTVFLTHEEAEKKLEEMKKNDRK